MEVKMLERRRERPGREHSRRFLLKPVEVGEEYDVDIRELSRRGDGVARIKGLVTFVPNAKPGDHLKVRITRVGRRFAEAEVVTEAASE
ncbi:MAG TPA: TRAM domain-containing protein [Candidatus Bathyarchaeota archaeon]|nr:TRAM domain-containing protein [Candidatus Bathyarchaeota archaeon]